MDPNIQTLLDLIVSSASAAVESYRTSGCDIPTLDSLEPPQLPSNLLSLRKVLRTLEAACQQLCTTLSPPTLTMYMRGASYIDMSILRTVVNLKVADILPVNSAGLPIDEIAEKTGTHPKKLRSVMRCLAATHCFSEVKPGVFANNRLSMTLRSSQPMSAMMSQRANTLMPRYQQLYEGLTDAEYGPSFAANRSAFSLSIRDTLPEASFYEFLNLHPQEGQLFNRSLSLLFTITEADAALSDFPWSGLPNGATLCDVGSGIGTFGLELARTQPHLELTLQDLPPVLGQAQKEWTENGKYRAAREQSTVNFIPFDFFKEGPVKDQDIYFVRQCLHNWADDDCVTILRNVCSSMSSSSRMLIHEYLLRPNVVLDQGDTSDIAPRPLLPNYGTGALGAHYQDVSMLILFNASERTLEDYHRLGQRAGLRFVKCWNLLETALLEFVVAA